MNSGSSTKQSRFECQNLYSAGRIVTVTDVRCRLRFKTGRVPRVSSNCSNTTVQRVCLSVQSC